MIDPAGIGNRIEPGGSAYGIRQEKTASVMNSVAQAEKVSAAVLKAPKDADSLKVATGCVRRDEIGRSRMKVSGYAELQKRSPRIVGAPFPTIFK